MRTKLSSKKVTNLTLKEYRQCYSLNLRAKGEMRSKLCHTRHRDNIDSSVFMIHSYDGVLLAWALVFKGVWDSRPTAFFYVRTSARRKGYGTRLQKAIRKKHGRFNVRPWDPLSREFFSAVTLWI